MLYGGRGCCLFSCFLLPRVTLFELDGFINLTNKYTHINSCLNPVEILFREGFFPKADAK